MRPSVEPLAASSCETAHADESFAWQVLCLRLGVIECHARGPAPLNGIALQRRNGGALVELPPGWGEAHPRTWHLLQEEVQAWERAGTIALELRG